MFHCRQYSFSNKRVKPPTVLLSWLVLLYFEFQLPLEYVIKYNKIIYLVQKTSIYKTSEIEFQTVQTAILYAVV